MMSCLSGVSCSTSLMKDSTSSLPSVWNITIVNMELYWKHRILSPLR